MAARMVAPRTGAELAELVELRRLLGRRHWDVAGEARDVGHAIDRFRSRSSDHVPYLPPHASRGLALADRLDDVAHRVERTHDALAAADTWLARGARRAFDAESGRQAAVTAWRTAPGSWARLQRWAYDLDHPSAWKYKDVRLLNEHHRRLPSDEIRRIRDDWNARNQTLRRQWDASWRAAREHSDGSRWSRVRADIADDVARLRGQAAGAATTLGDDAGRLARTWQGVSDSRIGAVGRLGSRAVGAGGVLVGGWDLQQGLREGDTERAVTGGLGLVASGAMLVPFPPVQAAGAIVTAGLLVYSYRDELASAGRAVVDAARRDIERKVEFARDVAGAAGDLAEDAADIAGAAWDAVKGLF